MGPSCYNFTSLYNTDSCSLLVIGVQSTRMTANWTWKWYDVISCPWSNIIMHHNKWINYDWFASNWQTNTKFSTSSLLSTWVSKLSYEYKSRRVGLTHQLEIFNLSAVSIYLILRSSNIFCGFYWFFRP